MPDNPQQLLASATALHEQGRLVEAERLYDQVLRLTPGDAVLWYNHGTLLKRMQRPIEALASFDRAVALKPDFTEALTNRGNSLRILGRLDEALASLDKAVSLAPGRPDFLHNRGLVLADMRRLEDAVASFDRALALRPDLVETLAHRSQALADLRRFDQALADIEKALSRQPGSAKLWSNRGSTLQNLKRFDEALASFNRALAIEPRYPTALYNRGCLLMIDLQQPQKALADFEDALTAQPDFAEGWNQRGKVLRELGQLDQALASFDKARALDPASSDALRGQGQSLFELNRVGDAITLFQDAARRLYGEEKSPLAGNPAAPSHKLQHDREQDAYQKAQKRGTAPGSRIAGRAVTLANDTARTNEQWLTGKPQMAVIDNLLTQEALEGLRQFCLEEPIWRSSYAGGYLGAFPESGFACPLLGQIAEELRAVYPVIFGQHPLNYMWGFKYDSTLSGIAIHADRAAVNVNFWLTPDDANLEAQSGGLVVWDVAAPLDWNFAQFNSDEKAIRDFLARQGAVSVRVPHRQNRAVIFDSDLFHETDVIRFREGYLNRRINVTMLYGRRNQP